MVKKRLLEDNGMVMIESIYCILLAMIVTFFILSIGFLLYQKVVVSIVANEVAEDVSQTYKFYNAKGNGDITLDDYNSVGLYRYFFRNKKIKEANEEKCKNFMNIRLNKTSLSKDDGSLYVNIELKRDDIGRHHYEITVKNRYFILLGDLLKVFGLNNTFEMSAKSNVMGVDVLHHINSVRTVSNILHSITGKIKYTGKINDFLSNFNGKLEDFKGKIISPIESILKYIGD